MTPSFETSLERTAEEIERDIAAATALFRREREEEPLEIYLSSFDVHLGTVEELVELTVDLSELQERSVEVVTSPNLLGALRFLAGPFISKDDLRVMADTSLSPGRLKSDPEAALRVVDQVLLCLDRRRFPWVGEMREPTESERDAAVLSTATLMATEQTRTLRRTQSKVGQEGAVATALITAGFVQVPPPREIRSLEEAPGPGQFCAEVEFGGRKADLVVGLWDRRRMAIECKVSNSATNSIKRVRDASEKAERWSNTFGTAGVVPCAVLSGVFKRDTLASAQSQGLMLFWAHRLDDLVEWIGRTRS